jgi:hypothetical protein
MSEDQLHPAVLEKLLRECYPFVVHAVLTIPETYPSGHNACQLLERLKPVVRVCTDHMLQERLKKATKSA